MKYLSVCSGIESASVAWQPLGWECLGLSEIEKFPSAVLAHHYPDVENFGDMNDYQSWPDLKPDVLVGGTPCQSFSVAGLRAGMDDPRGNLALVFVALAARYSPTWFVWENVPGVLSSTEGRDFGSFIGAMVKLGYGIAYRVLDAQYFGVAQRRRRVFVVGHLGDWRDSAEVLFEPESLRRNPPPSREAGKKVAGTLASRSTAGGGLGTDTELDGGLIPDVAATVLSGAPNDGGPSHGARSGHAKDSTLIPEVANPLTARMYKGINTTCDEGQTPIVVHGTQDPIHSDIAMPLQEKNAGQENEVIAFAQNQRDEVRPMEVAGALAAEPGMKQQTYIGSFQQNSMGGRGTLGYDEDTKVLRPIKPQPDHQMLQIGSSVRRLTPLECERLQGFPDGYTKIPKSSDSGRYKALGNAMAVPVMAWIGRRIQEAHDE